MKRTGVLRADSVSVLQRTHDTNLLRRVTTSVAARVMGLLMVAVAVTGCAGPTEQEPLGRTITHREVAAVALESLPGQPMSVTEWVPDDPDKADLVSVDLRFPPSDGDENSDGDLVRISVAPDPSMLAQPCDRPRYYECTELPTDVDDAVLQLTWQLAEPEEDPGVVRVTMLRGSGETSSVHWSGAWITDDPRRLDLLPINVDDAVAVLEDPRMRYEATAESEVLGKQLNDWMESLEAGPERVGAGIDEDHAIAMSFLAGYGGEEHFAGVISSPLLKEFGEDAIGGRLEADPFHPMVDSATGIEFQVTYDVLAAPEPPEWMSEDPCSSDELSGHCVRIEGERGPLVFAWKPADTAAPAREEEWVWMISLRADEVVAVRATMGVPEDKDLAMRIAGWDKVSRLLDSAEGGSESELGLQCGWCDEAHLARLSSGDAPVPVLE